MTSSWWKQGIIYQIYPRSFQDSNADGIGDLQGIIRRLDYLQWLGVDAIWLSPIFVSPMADFGYDVADYCNVDPMFGSLDDFDQLIAAATARDIRVILDYVPNHTSDQHPWFQEARVSRDNPKRDWYIWRDPAADGGPPNNWLSEFGGPAWSLDETTGQYYLRSFLPEQPDLNWRNPEVVAAMLDVLGFWLERGVAGFRIDVVDLLLKDAQFRDDPPNPDYNAGDNGWAWQALLHSYSGYQPEVHAIIRQIRAVLDSYGADRVVIGELDYFLGAEAIRAFYGDNDELHLPFNFGLFNLPWQADGLRGFVDDYDPSVPDFAWPVYVLSNHDRSRVASRIGTAQIRCAAMLLLSLRGTPFVYYGEELGMEDVPIPAERIQDPWGINMPGFGRDPVRTPMCWDDSAHAGFSTRTPWLPQADSCAMQNVAAQQADAGSMLNLYRSLIQLRKHSPALHSGGYCADELSTDAVFVYLRQHEAQQVLVALNLSDQPQSVALPQGGTLLLSTLLDRSESVAGMLRLRPHEGCLIELD